MEYLILVPYLLSALTGIQLWLVIPDPRSKSHIEFLKIGLRTRPVQLWKALLLRFHMDFLL